jgi:hypothetical protein
MKSKESEESLAYNTEDAETGSFAYNTDDAETGSFKTQEISPIFMLQPSIAGITDLIGLIETISELKLPKLKETASVERTVESCGGFRSGSNGENFFSTFDFFHR